MNSVLENAIKSGNIAGAYMISGASAQATQMQIDEFLLHLFCESKTACRKCAGCIKYLNRSHVDLTVIESKGKTIKIEDVRSIPAAVAQKAYEGGFKAIVIPDASMMTPQAQNALLKVLEEPPSNTVFLLGAQNIKNILPTIQSRCIIQKTSFSLEETQKRLANELKIPTLRARVLSRAANGDFYLAQKFFSEDFFAVREDVILVLNRLWNAKNMATSATLELIMKHENSIALVLDFALLYIRDVLLFKHIGKAEQMINEDKMTDIEQHAKQSDYVLVNTSDIVFGLVVKYAQCAGLNSKLAIERMLFELLEVVL